VTNNNKLTDGNIKDILGFYTGREDVQYKAKLVPNADVAVQDYNLSVSSYVEQEDTREVVDITVLNEQIRGIVERANTLRASIDEIIAEIEGGVE
jgi:type I restriction enzyme M protein